jgi:hypothetical protein
MRLDFPFSAVVGQDDLKLALLLIAVDPSIGGVLISGERGTAKSTVARGLAGLLPDLAIGRSAPFVELPLGATEDRVVGSLNISRILQDGKSELRSGLLARANGGVVSGDEVNLLPDALVDLLLDAAASGWVTVERDGISASEPARFVLIGTMNPEEGELRPQFLDRFGLCVQVARRHGRPKRRLGCGLSARATGSRCSPSAMRIWPSWLHLQRNIRRMAYVAISPSSKRREPWPRGRMPQPLPRNTFIAPRNLRWCIGRETTRPGPRSATLPRRRSWPILPYRLRRPLRCHRYMRHRQQPRPRRRISARLASSPISLTPINPDDTAPTRSADSESSALPPSKVRGRWRLRGRWSLQLCAAHA